MLDIGGGGRSSFDGGDIGVGDACSLEDAALGEGLLGGGERLEVCSGSEVLAAGVLA